MIDRYGLRVPGPPLAQRRIPPGLIKAGVVGAALFMAYSSGRSAESNSILLLAMFGAIPFFLALFATELELAVMLFLIYATFEGMVKNLLSNSPVAFLLRDIFLLAILGKLLFTGRAPRDPRNHHPVAPRVAAIALPMTLFIILSVTQFLNPTFDDLRISTVIGLGGVHQRLLPIVVFFAVLRYVKTRRHLDRLQKLVIYLGLIVAVVLLFQVVMGPERWLALGFKFYGQGAGYVYTPSISIGVPRPASTAQDAGAAAWFILTGILLLLGLLTRRKGSVNSLVWMATMAGTMLLAIALSYSRTAYMVLAMGFGLFLLIRNRSLGDRLPVAVGGILLTIAVVGAVLPSSYMEAVQHRAQMSVLDPVTAYTSQAGGRANQIADIPGIMAQFPLGAGMGRSGPGQATFSKWFPGSSFLLIENGFGAIIAELSFFGGALVAWLFLAMLAQGMSVMKSLKDEDLQATATALFVCIVGTLAAMFSMNPLDASPFNTYLWLAAGLLLALPTVEKNEAGAAGAAAPGAVPADGAQPGPAGGPAGPSARRANGASARNGTGAPPANGAQPGPPGRRANGAPSSNGADAPPARRRLPTRRRGDQP